jgi:hypothetical protein
LICAAVELRYPLGEPQLQIVGLYLQGADLGARLIAEFNGDIAELLVEFLLLFGCYLLDFRVCWKAGE